MSDPGWLEPIVYHQDARGWWASARNIAVCAPTKAKARAKLYRSVNRMYAERAGYFADEVEGSLR